MDFTHKECKNEKRQLTGNSRLERLRRDVEFDWAAVIQRRGIFNAVKPSRLRAIRDSSLLSALPSHPDAGLITRVLQGCGFSLGSGWLGASLVNDRRLSLFAYRSRSSSANGPEKEDSVHFQRVGGWWAAFSVTLFRLSAWTVTMELGIVGAG